MSRADRLAAIRDWINKDPLGVGDDSALCWLLTEVTRLEAALRAADDALMEIRQIAKDPSNAYEVEFSDVEGAVRYRCSEAREAIDRALAGGD